jgi:hypothetical protein
MHDVSLCRFASMQKAAVSTSAPLHTISWHYRDTVLTCIQERVSRNAWRTIQNHQPETTKGSVSHSTAQHSREQEGRGAAAHKRHLLQNSVRTASNNYQHVAYVA